MDQTFLVLFTAYLIARFPLRGTGGWALPLQILTVCVIATALLGNWQPWIVIALAAAPIVAVAGGLIKEPVAARLLPGARPDSPLRVLLPFVSEFVFHTAVVAALTWFNPQAAAAGWAGTLPTEPHRLFLIVLTIVAGLILNLQVGGTLIGALVQPLKNEVGPKFTAGLTNGSLYIGWLERALVMFFVLIGQIAGAGFLITAKSILRFSDASDQEHRQASEYIIIGTFLSFGWGLIVSVIAARAIEYWNAIP